MYSEPLPNPVCVCLDLVNSAAALGMVVSIPLRVEERRQRSWLVDIPDVAMEDIAALAGKCPQAQFIIGNSAGFTNSRLGRKGSKIGSRQSIDFCEFLTFTTIREISFRSSSKFIGWNGSGLETVL